MALSVRHLRMSSRNLPWPSTQPGTNTTSRSNISRVQNTLHSSQFSSQQLYHKSSVGAWLQCFPLLWCFTGHSFNVTPTLVRDTLDTLDTVDTVDSVDSVDTVDIVDSVDTVDTLHMIHTRYMIPWSSPLRAPCPGHHHPHCQHTPETTQCRYSV